MSKTGDKVIDTINESNEKPAPKKRATRRKTTKKSEGLGDTIEKITEATGIKQVVKAVAGDDCGCEERKHKLNRLFPYLGEKRMNEAQQQVFSTVVLHDFNVGRMTPASMVALRSLATDMGMDSKIGGACPGCVKRAVHKLKMIYEASCQS